MAGEPKLEKFLVNLSDKNFSLAEICNDSEKLEEVLWYLDGAHAAQVTRELERLEEDKIGIIVSNLTRIYPLSQELVLRILRDIPKSDHAFVNGLDVEEKIYTALKNLLKDAEDQKGRITKHFREYKEDIEKLSASAESMEKAAAEFQTLREEKRRLEARIAELSNETDEASIRADISALEDEERDLILKQEFQREKKEKLRRDIDNIKRELDSMQKDIDNGEELDLLRELLQKFPADAEDGK